MSQVIVYSTTFCPFCVMAKRLLTSKDIDFEEKNLTGDYDALNDLKNRTNHRTVPQIFINDKFIGGYEELAELNSTGELDKMLAEK